MGKKKLPIYEIEESIIEYLHAANKARLIIEAPTGSGKSTQLPQILINSGVIKSGEIVVLQPRRVAAKMLARRVASERGSKIGEEIGYQIRFEKLVSNVTKVRFVTEGILIRELISDPLLSHVGVIVFDEFHERHIYSDVLLALSKKMQDENRPDLKIIVMSATLASSSISKYLENSQTLKSSGKAYPVEIRHLNARVNSQTIVDSVTKAVKTEIIKKDLKGDVLIFLPGVFEIKKTIEKLKLIKQLKECVIVPLYGELNPRNQEIALEISDKRKIIVSTNLAETSLTIEGVEIVIDCGLARIPSFDESRGINTLLLKKISIASADQRAGRAGRVRPGICIRLWSESENLNREKYLLPEIKRLDLTEVFLLLSAFHSGSKFIMNLDWLDPPSDEAIGNAKDILISLNALERESERITDIGKMMVSYPVHPRLARMIIESGENDCLNEVLVCIALIQGRGIFDKKIQLNSSEFTHKDDTSDFQPMIRAWMFAYRANFDFQKCHSYNINAKAAKEAYRIFNNLAAIAKKQGFHRDELNPDYCGDRLAKAFLIGFSDNLYRRLSMATLSCELVGLRRGKLEKGSLAGNAEVGIAAEVNEIQGKDVSVVISKATSIEMAGIREVLGEHLIEQEIIIFDSSSRRVVTEEVVKFMDLILFKKSIKKPPSAESAQILAKEVMNGNLKLKGWGDKCNVWISRVEFVSRFFPEYEIPKFEDADKLLVLTDLCEGALSYKEIKDKDCWPFLQNWLSGLHADVVNKIAPERIKLKNGTEVKVIYGNNGPKISVLLQRLYDVDSTPLLHDGRIPITVEILAPNHRPVQTTNDLSSFWKDSYSNVKKQLKGRYPKHEWR